MVSGGAGFGEDRFWFLDFDYFGFVGEDFAVSARVADEFGGALGFDFVEVVFSFEDCFGY